MSIVILTEAAASKAGQLLAGSENPEQALRVRVVNGGCNGMRYELLFDPQVGEDDTEFEQHGLRVVVDAESVPHLEGTTVDYHDGLNESGFKIDNPRAEGTCGCGESFNV